MSKIVACPDNQAAFDHLSLVASRCLGGKREQYRFSLLKAMKSLKLYPLPIESIEEALSLDGVGPALAKEVMKGIATFKSGNKTQEKETPLDKSSDGEVRVKAKSSKVDRSVLGVIGASPLPKRSKPCISDLSFSAAMKKKSQSEISFATEIFDSPQKDVPDGDNTSLSNKSLHRREKIIDSNIVLLQIDRSEDIPSSSPEKVSNVIQDATRCKKSTRDSMKTAWSKSEKHSLYLEIPESPCMIRSSCTNSGGRDVYSYIKNDSGKAELNRDEHQNKSIKNDTVIRLAKSSAENPTDPDITDVSKSNQYFDLTQDDCEPHALGKFRLFSDEKSAKKIDIQNDMSYVKSNETADYHNKHINVVDTNKMFACRRHSRELLENNEENKMDNYQHCTDAGDSNGMRKVASNGNTYGSKSHILDSNNTYQSIDSQTFRNDNNNCKDNYLFTENNNYDGNEYDYHTYDDYDNFGDTYDHNNCENSNYDVTENYDGNNNNNNNDNGRNDTKIYSDNDKIITTYKISTKIIDKNVFKKYTNNLDRIHGSSSGDDDDDSSVDMDFNKGRKIMNKKDKKFREEGNKISKITESAQDKTINDKMKEDEKKKKEGKSEQLKCHFTDKYEHTIDMDEGSELLSNFNYLKSPEAQRKREHNNNKIWYQEEREMTDGETFFPNRALQTKLSTIINHSENSSFRDNLDYVTHSKEERESRQQKGEIEEERHRDILQIHDIDDEDGSNKERLLEHLKGRGGNRKNKEIEANVENNLFDLSESYDKNFNKGKTKKDEKREKKKDKIVVKKKDSINEGVKKKISSSVPSTYNASVTDAEIETEIETLINNTDDKPIKKLKKSIILPIGMKTKEKSENSKKFKAASVNTENSKSDVGLIIGKKQSSPQALSKFDVSVKKNKENNENIYGNINVDLESQKLPVKQKSSFSDHFAIDSSDEEEVENRPDIDDLPIDNSPVIDPFLAALLGDINDWEPVLIVDVREKDHNLIQVSNLIKVIS